MPLIKTKKGCWKWGQSGKEYCGPGAKKKAIKQGYTIDKKHFKEEMSKSKLDTLEEYQETLREIHEVLAEAKVPFADRVHIGLAIQHSFAEAIE
jgi:oligoribonuclease NrnB/cAMP/cGMP phosphodiesterase (DHH superfamily)